MRAARRRAGLSQRALAERAGVPQATIARIEAGQVDPRIGTVEVLLTACGLDLDATPRLGDGIDRAHIRTNLALTPAERLERVSRAANALANLRGIARAS